MFPEINEYIALILGLFLLFFSGDFLVKGSVSLAAHFKVSTLVIGVTVVSFGTSAPELLVSAKAALSGHPDISLGNVIGSNISNIALVLGLTVILLPMPVKRISLFFDWPVMTLSGLLLLLFMFTNYTVEFYEGIIFVVFLVIYIILSLKKGKKDTDIEAVPEKSLWTSLVFIIISAFGLVAGSHYLVTGASEAALNWGVSERIISLTVVAFGTSVPELATSLIAAFKKQTDISVGNIIGSNSFNILAILGITSLVSPIPVNPDIIKIDSIWMLAIYFLLAILILPIKRMQLSRFGGIFLILTYIIYVYFLFLGD